MQNALRRVCSDGMLISGIPSPVMSEDPKIVNRILLTNGGMFDTVWSEEEYLNQMDNVGILRIPGVFGECLLTDCDKILGFISRRDLDVEKAMQAQQNMARAMGQLPRPNIVTPGNRSGLSY